MRVCPLQRIMAVSFSRFWIWVRVSWIGLGIDKLERGITKLPIEESIPDEDYEDYPEEETDVFQEEEPEVLEEKEQPEPETTFDFMEAPQSSKESENDATFDFLQSMSFPMHHS